MAQATSSWLRSLFSDQLPNYHLHPDHAASKAQASGSAIATETHGPLRLNVVWLSRKTFEAVNVAKLTPHQQGRVMHSEDELVAALQQHVLSWNRRSCLLQQHPMYGKLRQQAQQQGPVPASRRALQHAAEGGERQKEGWQLLPGLPFKPQQRPGGGTPEQQRRGTAAASHSRSVRKLTGWPQHQQQQQQRRRPLQQDERVLSLLAEWITKGKSNDSSILMGGGQAHSRIAATPCRHTQVLFDFVVMEGGDMSLEDQVHVLMRWVGRGAWQGARSRAAALAPKRCLQPLSSLAGRVLFRQQVEVEMQALISRAPLLQVGSDRGHARRGADAADLHAAG